MTDDDIETTPEAALAAVDRELADDVNDFGDVGHSLKLAQVALRQVQNGKCKNCKHWRPFDGKTSNWATDHLKLGLCGKIIDGGPTVALEGQLALTEDLSGCSGLRTAAEFGCVLFEAK